MLSCQGKDKIAQKKKQTNGPARVIVYSFYKEMSLLVIKKNMLIIYAKGDLKYKRLHESPSIETHLKFTWNLNI